MPRAVGVTRAAQDGGGPIDPLSPPAPQHAATLSTPADVARVYSAELELPLLDALLTDIAALGEHVSVSARYTDQAHVAEGQSLTLDDARALLVLRRALGVQLRYVHRGQGWIDTLLVTPAGFRLVRTSDAGQSLR